MKKMRNSRGITLVALIAYIIITIVILGILAAFTANFRNNINDTNTQTMQDAEFDKLNVQLLKETKTEKNKITIPTEDSTDVESITFENGNTYTYNDGIVYLTNTNVNIKIAENIESCKFSVKTMDGRQRLTVTVEIMGIKRITEYLFIECEEHEYGDEQITKLSTCEEEGEKTKRCIYCGAASIVPIDKISHEYEKGKCTMCEKTIQGVRVAKNTQYIYEEGKTAMIPAGFTVSGLESEQSIEDGLVIYLIPEGTTVDWTNGTSVATAQQTYDQFVWIPIKNTTDASSQDINDMYICQNKGTGNYGTGACTITVVNNVATCTTHGNCTAMAGRLYATQTGAYYGQGYTETYTASSGLREPDTVSDYDGNGTYLGNLNTILGTSYSAASDFKADLQSEYNQIVKSVYENQGFYVGRYETSNMTTADGTAIQVIAGKTEGINNTNWYYMYAQQKDYAINKGLSSSAGSSMIQGAAFDQVMKFVSTSSYSVTTTGNVGHTSSQGLSNVYQTGGLNYPSSATVTYKDVSKNIYDLEGNITAWTTEANSTSYRVCRGRCLQL